MRRACEPHQSRCAPCGRCYRACRTAANRHFLVPTHRVGMPFRRAVPYSARSAGRLGSHAARGNQTEIMLPAQAPSLRAVASFLPGPAPLLHAEAPLLAREAAMLRAAAKLLPGEAPLLASAATLPPSVAPLLRLAAPLLDGPAAALGGEAPSQQTGAQNVLCPDGKALAR